MEKETARARVAGVYIDVATQVTVALGEIAAFLAVEQSSANGHLYEIGLGRDLPHSADLPEGVSHAFGMR
jgi:hypothetical protein